MRIITLTCRDGVGITATLTDESGEEIYGVTKIIFDDLNVTELWTGTLVYLHGGQEDERVYLVTAA